MQTAHVEIDEKGISELQHLCKLDAGYNSRITNVNHLRELRELKADGACGIDQAGLSELQHLRKLSAHDNSRLTNIVVDSYMVH